MAKSEKRFRVALSFPGERRARVEKIAEILAEKLGREKVLYDKWHAAEFARPNLDIHLPALYRNKSQLIVIFLCKGYARKEWCGLESRAWRELLKKRKDKQLMFLRFDDAKVPGISSIDGFIDISEVPDDEVAAAIFERLNAPVVVHRKAYRSFTSKLPVVNPLLIGREKELGLLDDAWANTATNFVQVIAAGGTGKTSLVDKWFRRHLGEATVFGWSFYSQGSSQDRQTSSDSFFAEIISWFRIDIAPTASIWAKAAAIANHLRNERVLLLLDGVEPLQEQGGTLRDLPLKALLQELDTSNLGLVVCTTRVRIDIPDDESRVRSIDLDNLTAEQGAQYLRSLKVDGTDEELQEASQEYWSHALALTLLGTYLVDFCNADIRRRIEIPELIDKGSHAHRVIGAYDRMFPGTPEADILHALGYFDRPAEPEALKLVRPEMDDRTYRAALKRLHSARLILTKDPDQPLDCHPLVREHFAATATAEGHSRLYEHYKLKAPQLPDTIEEMTPLFYAVYHGCEAGRHQETLNQVYDERILRGGEFHLTRKLGAFGADLSLLANFFATKWSSPVAALTAAAQSWVVSTAGFTLRAVGRLSEAVGPMRASAEAGSDKDRAKHLGSLRQLFLVRGLIKDALAAARRAVSFADLSGDKFQKMTKRALLAATLHQSGALAEAERLFSEVESLQAERQPTMPFLYSVQGYLHCDLLLDLGRAADVRCRAARSLSIDERSRRLLDIGLDHLSLGRAYPSGSHESIHHLNQAVEYLRRAGMLDYLPRALLARGTEQDLEEVRKIATRSGMRLFLVDYHLAKRNIAEAEKLINETGYHRRDKQLADLKAKAAHA